MLLVIAAQLLPQTVQRQQTVQRRRSLAKQKNLAIRLTPEQLARCSGRALHP